ncbi:MAG: thermonuclease family protein [Alphaproteobacteria bacterium]|nr:thermonuclease family protein [Alphaproteobacteria bacterium]
MVFSTSAAAADNIKGRPRVINGDTITIRKVHIWLHGIDAPEKRQKCAGDGRVWSCGKAARTVLKQAIGTERVSCVSKPMGEDKHGDRRGRVPAVCSVGGLVLNEWMVKMGWVMALRHHGTDYLDEEQTARQKRRGVWVGTFVEPRKWRRQNAK